MPRIQGLRESGVLTANKLLKTTSGEVHSLLVSWKDATVGDIIGYLLDALTDTSSDQQTFLTVPLIASTANGMFEKTWPQGKKFDTGLFWKEGVVTLAYVEVTYK